MTSPEGSDPSNSVSAAEWESFIAISFTGEDDALQVDSLLKDMFMDARKMLLGTAGVASVLIYENGCEHHSNPKDTLPDKWPTDSPLKPLRDSKYGPLFTIDNEDNNMDILLFQGSLLTSDPKRLLRTDKNKPLFILPDLHEMDKDACIETTLDGHRVLLSRAMVLGGHAIWRRAITRQAKYRYTSDYPELSFKDFDSVNATTNRSGEKLYLPKYSLVSKGVTTKVEILSENDTTTTLHI
jgi:hypothetical protein